MIGVHTVPEEIPDSVRHLRSRLHDLVNEYFNFVSVEMLIPQQSLFQTLLVPLIECISVEFVFETLVLVLLVLV